MSGNSGSARVGVEREAGELPALDLADHVGEAEEHDRRRPGHHRVDHLVAAAERHAHDVDAVLLVQLVHEIGQHEREGAVAQRAGLGLGERDELGNGFDAERRIDHQRVGVDEQVDDRLEILLRIERQALEGELVVDHRLARQHAERIAVGRGLGAGARADVEPAAGPVLDHEGLAETLLQFLGHQPREHVAAAAGTERDDDLHRPRRPVLRRRSRRRRTSHAAKTIRPARIRVTALLPPRFVVAS